MLVKIPIKDFAKKIICDGHLYVAAGEGRRFYVMQPGMLIEEDFIKKHALQNTVFEFESVIHKERSQEFIKHFRDLKYLQFEKDLERKCREIGAYFHSVYQSDEHFLTFALAAFQEFCLIPKESLKRMHDLDINLFRKSLYSAGFAVITAIANDFYHYTMIRDFYNLTLGLDIGLCDQSYSYYVAQGCNQENLSPGSGANWMRQEKATEQEIAVFLKHPQKSYEFIKNLSILSYGELSEILLYQHELANGQGFPRGISKGEVSSWEAVVLLSSSFVDIADSFPFEKNVLGYLGEFQNVKLDLLPVKKIYTKLIRNIHLVVEAAG